MPENIVLSTDDGDCRAFVFRGPAPGPWPAVLFFMDGLGIRPALFEMAERMAARGYYVLLPDLFHRGGLYAPMDAKRIFADPALREDLSKRFIGKVSAATAMCDTAAALAFLAAQPDVIPGKLGATGYCMGGRMALIAGGHFPDRFAAIAGYHPGNVATDAADSAHLVAPKIQARVYIGRASEDPTFPDDMLARLERALTEGGVAHTIETYPARHGWVPSDTPVHDVAAAERHWETLFALLDGALRYTRAP